MSAERQSYRARWLFPVDADPIEHGTIEIEDSQISAIHSSYDPRAEELGNVAIIPGLVNAHTHLEFSDLSEPLQPASPITDWIRALVSHRQTRSTPAAVNAGNGFREAGQSGTTLLGDIATEGWSPEAFTTPGPCVVCFRELIALEKSQFDKQLSIARRHLECTRSPLSSTEEGCGDAVSVFGSATTHSQCSHPREAIRFARGISPHAPYSVHPELFHKLVELAKEFDSPLAMHLAETDAELELLAKGTGEFVDLLNDFGLWREEIIPEGRTPFDYLKTLVDLKRALIVHGNYLSAQEIDFLAEHPQLTVVYCPRTHDFFGHDEHPWLRMLDRSVSVAIGTDSRASNPDLNLWREITFLSKKNPDVDPQLLLELGTIRGARALGFEHVTGSLTAGKSADLAVVSLTGGDGADPYRALLHPLARIVNTMCSGRWIAGH